MAEALLTGGPCHTSSLNLADFNHQCMKEEPQPL